LQFQIQIHQRILFNSIRIIRMIIVNIYMCVSTTNNNDSNNKNNNNKNNNSRLIAMYFYFLN